MGDANFLSRPKRLCDNMSGLFKKLQQLVCIFYIKLKWQSHITFAWKKCWNIRIRSGFEIQQFPLPGKLKLELKKNITIEKDVWIRGSAVLKIGTNTYIGRRTVIGCNESIHIGNNCLLAENVRIQDTDHCFKSKNIPINKQGIVTAPVRVGDDVWIGYGVVITKGVVIGDGSIIGANSVVTRDIPPYSIAVGSPACVIRTRGKNK